MVGMKGVILLAKLVTSMQNEKQKSFPVLYLHLKKAPKLECILYKFTQQMSVISSSFYGLMLLQME